MGKAALEGLPGVKKVLKGWLEGREINRMTYDPARISIKTMEQALKRAGTWQGTRIPTDSR